MALIAIDATLKRYECHSFMFFRRLRELAKNTLLPIAFSTEPHKISIRVLWDGMTTLGWPPKRATWIANINSNSAILIDTWTWAFLQNVTVQQIKNALRAVSKT